MDKCPICSSPLIGKDEYESDIFIYNCYRCGKFKITEDAIKFQCHNLNDEQIANISGWIKEHQDIIIDNEKLKSLMTLKTSSVSEKANSILLSLYHMFPIAGTHFNLEISKVGDILDIIKQGTYPDNPNDQIMRLINEIGPKILPIISSARIINKNEFYYIVETYLRKEKGFISETLNQFTPKGWAYLESLRQANPESKKAFVAMWFETEMEKIYDEFIAKAIKAAGYKPIQIGRKEHNNDINDEIIGEIRSCKFIIADFTGNRGGVYYETGFAYGLNIPVIYTCKKDQLKNVHFDVNHRNIIVWENGEELYERLLNRINSTIT